MYLLKVTQENFYIFKFLYSKYKITMNVVALRECKCDMGLLKNYYYSY